VQTPGATFQIPATITDKIIVFEIVPEMCLNVGGGYRTIAVQTSASNAANITAAELFIYGSYQGASEPSSYI